MTPAELRLVDSAPDAANDAAALIDIWLSCQDIADMRLPGMPTSKRRVQLYAGRHRWDARCAPDGTMLVRARQKKGGGLEYHVDLLPPAARAKVLKTAQPEVAAAPIAADNDPRSAIWSWFESQGDGIKAKAARNLAIVCDVARLVRGGMTVAAAVAHAAGHYGVSTASIHSWRSAVKGIDQADWLPHLAPRYVGGGRKAEVDPDIFRYFVSLYCTNNKRTYAQCHRMAQAKADEMGIKLPHWRTFARKLEAEIDPLVVLRKREGMEKFGQALPPQQRSVAGLHAMELLNIDGHLWDVFVRWPGEKLPVRPMMVAIQDVYSRMILGWRVDLSENVTVTRLALYDVLRKYGIPKGMVLDNSRTFASKKLTEGAKTRFRGRIRDEAPLGILPALSINPHWALPYHGQSKPIERAFRDLCSTISRGAIEFEGAWTGNRIDNKPENYRSKAIDLDLFLDVVARGIDEHNHRVGRNTEMCEGKHSFAQVFEASYAVAGITKATPEQLRLAMLSTEHGIMADRKSGFIKLYGNRYWCEEMVYVAGEKVSVRFDPDALHSSVHVYDAQGKYIAEAPLLAASQFLSEGDAKAAAKRKADFRKKSRAAEEAYDLMTAKEMEAFQTVREITAFEPEAKVVRPLRGSSAAAALKVASAPAERRVRQTQAATAIDELAAARALRLVE